MRRPPSTRRCARRANASQQLYVQVLEKVEEAGLAAGIQGSNISVVDYARQPVKPVAPDLPLYLAITLLCRPLAGDWRRAPDGVDSSLLSSRARTGCCFWRCLPLSWLARWVMLRRPRPAPPALPTGVVRLPSSQQPQNLPNPMESPAVWNGAGQAGLPPTATGTQSASPMPAPIAPGDFLDVSEVHTPEFHSAVRVSPSGTVTLPMIHEVRIGGMDEQGRRARHRSGAYWRRGCYCIRWSPCWLSPMRGRT
jgi:hypothetical protein